MHVYTTYNYWNFKSSQVKFDSQLEREIHFWGESIVVIYDKLKTDTSQYTQLTENKNVVHLQNWAFIYIYIDLNDTVFHSPLIIWHV